MCRKERFHIHAVGTEISTTPMELIQGLPCSSNGKESACNTGDPGSIPGSGRSSGKGNGNPLPYSWLENPMDRAAWQGTICGIAKSWAHWATDTNTIEIIVEVPQKMKNELSYDPVTPLLGLYTKEIETGSQRATCTLMFIAALILIAKIWKQPKCLSTD